MARFDGSGWRIDLDFAKSHIDELLNAGLPKDALEKIIPKWAAYHQDEKNKLIQYLKNK